MYIFLVLFLLVLKKFDAKIASNFIFLEQVTRIELALNAWEALVLPLNYTCIKYLFNS